MTDCYESLRRGALGQDLPGGHGMALVIHRGVSAWMAVWRAPSVSPAPPVHRDLDRPALEGARVPALVEALASLALGAIGR